MEMVLLLSGVFVGIAVVVGVTCWLAERRRRAAYVRTLGPDQRNRLEQFEKVGGTWREWRAIDGAGEDNRNITRARRPF
jgi:hypothetical protein